MASHQLIDDYLAALRGRLPGPVVDELADGLLETWQHHQRQGMPADEAAKAAVTEFGTVRQVSDAFIVAAPGRRVARALLATGPLVGISWGTSLIAAKVWAWPIPPAAAIAYAVLLLATVAVLLVAANTRHSLRLTRLGNAGAASLLLLDAAMLTFVLLGISNFVWPMAIAIPISLARIAITTESLAAPLRHRRT